MEQHRRYASRICMVVNKKRRLTIMETQKCILNKKRVYIIRPAMTSIQDSGTPLKQDFIEPCEGDFGGDGDVDGSDLAVFAAGFGRTDCQTGPVCEGDFDSDGDVDGSDLAIFAEDFGRRDCPIP